MSVRNSISKEGQDRIVAAIKTAEKNTSGEVRVHIEKKCEGDVLDASADWFARLNMHKTKLRNGVLIYLAIDDRKFAIIGDAGINEKVPPGFWDSTSDEMIKHFKNNDLVGGLEQGILKAGEELKKYFPWQTDDVNELSDDISFGDEDEK